LNGVWPAGHTPSAQDLPEQEKFGRQMWTSANHEIFHGIGRGRPQIGADEGVCRPRNSRMDAGPPRRAGHKDCYFPVKKNEKLDDLKGILVISG
jgi:hypothetical protein